MNRTTPEFDPEELPDPICATCGGVIEELDQQCPALAEGVCAP